MKKIISLIFIGLIAYIALGSFFLPKTAIIADENRTSNKLPDLPKKLSFKEFKAFFKGIDNFANDNIPQRTEFLNIYRYFVNLTGDQIAPDKAFRGKNGWLFLGNSYDKNIEKLEGKLFPSPDNSHFVKLISSLGKLFQSKGADVTFLLGPRKESVYPEFLPNIIVPSKNRYITPYLVELQKKNIPTLDPTLFFKSKKENKILYWKTDTHWNQVGASYAFEYYMKHVSLSNCPTYTSELENTNHIGDLINIGSFENPTKNLNDNYKIIWSKSNHLVDMFIHDEKIPSYAWTQIIENDEAPNDTAIWIIGDSFRSSLIPFFSHCFKETHVHHIGYIDNNKLLEQLQIAKIKPKYVVFILTERTF